MKLELVRQQADALRDASLSLLREAGRMPSSDGLPVRWDEIQFQEQSLTDVAQAMAEAAQVASSIELDGPLPSKQMLTELHNALQTAEHRIHSLTEYAITEVRNGGRVERLDATNGLIIITNGGQSNLLGILQEVVQTHDTLVRRIGSILPFATAKGRKPFVPSAGLKGLVAEASAFLEQARESANDAGASAANAASLVAQIEGARTVASEAASIIQASLAQANSLLGNVQQTMTQIQATLDQGASTEAQISAVKSNLVAFQASFESQMQAAESAQIKLSQTEQRLDESLGKSAALIDQAEKMLRGATVAGLAKTFGDMNGSLGRSEGWALASVYLFTVLTLAAALPLAIPALVPAWELISAASGGAIPKPTLSLPTQEIKDGFGLAAYLAARGGLILPFGVLLAFSVARHNALFRLRQHYAFKYSIAMSVEGFKRQAPAYQEEIAAMALDLVAFNPAERLRGQSSNEWRVGRMFRLWRERLLEAAEKRLAGDGGKTGKPQ